MTTRLKRKRPVRKKVKIKKAGPPKGIKDVKDATPNRAALIYGRSGTGKTTLATSWPSTHLIIDMGDFGTDSVEDIKGLKVYDALTWERIEEIYWYLKEDDHPYTSASLDTITQMQAIIRNDVAGDKKLLTLKQHGEIADRMKTWLMHFRDLKMDIVFLAQERMFDTDDGDDDELSPYVGPAVSPSICTYLPGIVNLVGNTFVQNIKTKVKGKTKTRKAFSLRLGPHESHITKARKRKSLIIPSVVEDPTYAKLMAITKGTKDGSKKKKR